MSNFEHINSQIINSLKTRSRVKLFICFSNLHALQTITLQCTEFNIALCTKNVSIRFMQQHFQGEIIVISDDQNFSWSQLYPYTQFLKKKWSNLSTYIGNKHNYWATYILNNFPPKRVNILDDGLSSYNICEEIYWEKNLYKRTLKKMIYLVSSKLGMYYFHESNSSDIDRKCSAHYFFPEHITHNSKVEKINLDVEKFKYYLNLYHLPYQKEVFIASFNESKKLMETRQKDPNVEYILHPRVSGIAPILPNEILSFHSDKVIIGASSLIIFLLFVGYEGEFCFNDCKRAKSIHGLFKDCLNPNNDPS